MATALHKHVSKGLDVQVSVNVQVRNDQTGQYSSSPLNYGHMEEFKGLTFAAAGDLVADVTTAVEALVHGKDEYESALR